MISHPGMRDIIIIYTQQPGHSADKFFVFFRGFVVIFLGFS